MRSLLIRCYPTAWRTRCGEEFMAIFFLAVHFWRIRKDGGISGPL